MKLTLDKRYKNGRYKNKIYINECKNRIFQMLSNNQNNIF